MYLYGAGGHAKVVMDILRANGIEPVALVDDGKAPGHMCGVPVVSPAPGQSPMIITVGNCSARRRIAGEVSAEFATAVHPSAVLSPSATLGEGTVVMQGAVVQAGAEIGRHCIVNTGASVDHECRIADFVHVAPGCVVSGDVSIGEGTWLGVGSTVIQGVRIGAGCMIGAGSVVVSDIPDNSLAYGVPCRVVRNLVNDNTDQ